jgi:hypothetical protein
LTSGLRSTHDALTLANSAASLMFMSVARRSRGSHDMRAAAAFAPI